MELSIVVEQDTRTQHARSLISFERRAGGAMVLRKNRSITWGSDEIFFVSLVERDFVPAVF